MVCYIKLKVMLDMKNETNDKILGVITARGGSKRLPGKNIKPLAGKPLIAHTIETALDSCCFCEVLVSTDSMEIATISKKYDAVVPGLRPSHLAQDDSASIDVVLDLLKRDQYKDVDAVMLLQPTSPFRTVDTIKLAISKLTASVDSVISVSKVLVDPSHFYRLDGDNVLQKPSAIANSSLEHQLWCSNGCIYLTKKEILVKCKNFYGDVAQGLFINDIEAIDINTKLEWMLAESIATKVFSFVTV